MFERVRRDAMEDKTIFPIIESRRNALTNLEKCVADFFIRDIQQGMDLSADAVSRHLHVSKSTLTRFAKKCGFDGYREFIFVVNESVKSLQPKMQHNDIITQVLLDYEELLRKCYSIIDEHQLERITELIKQANHVYLIGKGSSALVAKEIQTRFTRMGIRCSNIEEEDMLVWHSLLVDDSNVVIGFSLSGETRVIIDALRDSRRNGAHTILVSSQDITQSVDIGLTEMVLVGSIEHLANGNRVSPQFPLLIFADCLFSYYKKTNHEEIEAYYSKTIIQKEE